MAAWFVKLLNMSITASFIAIAVMLARFIFRKVAPKRLICFLWVLVAVRLIFPFTIESDFSILPASGHIPSTVISNETSAYNAVQEENGFTVTVTGEGEDAFQENESVNENNDSAPSTQQNKSPVSLGSIAVIVWGIGCAAMLSFMAISYFRLSSKLSVCVKTDKNIYLADGINTSFILGVIKPTIYIPSDTVETERKHILSHEKSHIKRLDHVWKPLGYLLLSLNWFNPIMWLSYALLCKDIELACDEKAVSSLSIEEKKEYSRVLLRCSVPKSMITACPLAFGENSVKERVKAMKYNKKYAIPIVIAFVAVCAVCALCLLTVPKTKKSVSAESDNKININNSDETGSNEKTPSGDSAVSGLTKGDKVIVQAAKQRDFKSDLPLESGAKLLADNSYANVMTDTDGDGLQDRITYAALSNEVSYICVEYGNASKANTTFTLKNGVLRPQIAYSVVADKTIVYITDKTADAQNVYPFAISKSGKITPVINKNAKYLSENSILSHSSFVKGSFGKWVDNSLVITYGRPYVVISIPERIRASKHFDASYGLRFSYKDNSIKVNTENNTVECKVYCAISDVENGTAGADFTPVTATLTFTCNGESFKLKNIDFRTDYPCHTQDTMPTPQPQVTATPEGNGKTYAETITLKGNATMSIDLDGDGKKEKIECKEKAAAEGYAGLKSVKISSSGGEALYSCESYFLKEVILADITGDGRLAVFIVEYSDSLDKVSAFFADGESIKTISFNGYKALEGCLKSIKNGVVTVETGSVILGTHQWYYKAAYNESTGNIEKVNSAYFCEENGSHWHKLKRDTYAYDKDGNKTAIKAGTEFECYRTDMKTYIKLKDRNGNVYKLDIQESYGENWPYLINGIWQEELFTDIEYPG